MADKVALVTGAAAGIGKACSVRLAKEGVAVGVLDLKLADAEAVAAEIVAAGGKAIGLEADISKTAQVEAAVAKLREAFGPVTIVVNNAGISNFFPFEELTEKHWDDMYEINVKGTFIVTRAVVPDMKAAGWGRVVNISSSSVQSGSVDQIHYAASKGAVVAMTRSLAQALGPHGITVNNIPPGSVMGTIMSEANKHRFPIPFEQIAQMLPVRRLGIPEDIANACAWLCSEDTGYVTGQTIGVNGGRVMS
ncbi:SDR family NAD(P)-dependent oxidoreductase [Sphingomonas naphthae]|uniref:SDR family NAD(P)-dependent oxidoreductase n=1 Tax=Sphingomonas naphthae TaxID=1813468 RepID=A0ABY7TJY9_9SPHN|nr:SDR family NAD(P)-dependent oxidoreductase [Sphingomonas naphthae]WCT73474.1 SDR family NAD(P)-dependent oxidoreductase [Sphingomonas naphthae]